MSLVSNNELNGSYVPDYVTPHEVSLSAVLPYTLALINLNWFWIIENSNFQSFSPLVILNLGSSSKSGHLSLLLLYFYKNLDVVFDSNSNCLKMNFNFWKSAYPTPSSVISTWNKKYGVFDTPHEESIWAWLKGLCIACMIF